MGLYVQHSVFLPVASNLKQAAADTVHAEFFMHHLHTGGAGNFLSVETLRTLAAGHDPTLQSLKDFAEAPDPRLESPLDVAANVTAASDAALKILDSISANSAMLGCELQDIRAWAFLGRYFGLKLQGAVSYVRFRLHGKGSDGAAAVRALTQALAEWQKLAAEMAGPASCVRDTFLLGDVDMGKGDGGGFAPLRFSWGNFTAAAREDIAIALAALCSAGCPGSSWPRCC